MFCRSCGRQLLVAAQFCADCGMPVQAPEQVRPIADEGGETTRLSVRHSMSSTQVVPRTPQQTSKVWPYVAGALIGFVLLFGGVLLFLSASGWLQTAIPAPHAQSTTSTPAPERAATASTESPTPTITNSVVLRRETTTPSPTYDTSHFPPAIVTKYVHPVYQALHYRISFQKGYYGGSVHDILPKLNRYYTVDAKAGQTLTVTLSSSTEDTYFFVSHTDGDQEGISPGEVHGTWSGGIPDTGSYTIFVNRGQVMRGKAMPFELIVALR